MIDDDPHYVNLETMDQGAAVEKFNDAWDEILANIRDPNTSAVKKRQVVLTVTVIPNEDRDRAQLSIECVAKTAEAKARISHIHISTLKDEGIKKVVASEHNPRQPRIFTDDELRGMNGGPN